VTQTLDDRRAAVSVDELKRAWTAIQAGRFRIGTGETSDPSELAPLPAGRVWEPGPGERVLLVIGCAGSCGASTIALALAGAAAAPARVVECSSVTASGLAAASTAELGPHESGWTRGTRDGVLLERVSDVLVSIQEVPTPSTPDPFIGLTVLDVGWEIGHVLTARAWVGEQVLSADLVVLVTTATVPGLRRLEGALDLLAATGTRDAGTRPCAAVIGPKRKKWPRPVEYSVGPLTRGLDQAGRLVGVPQDRALAIAGLDGTPLPTPLLAAAATLLRLLPARGIAMKGSTP
jgi:hypothetical protein